MVRYSTMALSFLFVLWAHAEDVASGLLKVRSTVANAEVYLDGKLLGTVPLIQMVPVGSHQVRVVVDNYDPFVRKVDVAEGQTTELQATLIAGTGSVEFSGPAGAKIWIDGQDRGALPIRLRDLPPGKHHYRVEAPLYEPFEADITTVKGRNYLLPVQMKSSRGIFVVESNPPGAVVTIDGTERGKTPLRLENVQPGVHTVSVRAEGHAMVIRQVNTSDGSRGEVKATLPEGGTMLKVLGGGTGTQVLLDGVNLGTGPTIEAGPFEKGRHRMTIVEGEHVVDGTVSFSGEGSVAYRLTGDSFEEVKPLTQQWGFWAAVGGGAAVCGAGAITAAVLLAPQPVPDGDQVVVLP